MVARRYARANLHFFFCMISSLPILPARRQNCDELHQPIKEAIEQFPRRRFQIDKDPSAIVRIASQFDQSALSQAVDDPLGIAFRCARCRG
jgi:hypothetical protein